MIWRNWKNIRRRYNKYVYTRKSCVYIHLGRSLYTVIFRFLHIIFDSIVHIHTIGGRLLLVYLSIFFPTLHNKRSTHSLYPKGEIKKRRRCRRLGSSFFIGCTLPLLLSFWWWQILCPIQQQHQPTPPSNNNIR